MLAEADGRESQGFAVARQAELSSVPLIPQVRERHPIHFGDLFIRNQGRELNPDVIDERRQYHGGLDAAETNGEIRKRADPVRALQVQRDFLPRFSLGNSSGAVISRRGAASGERHVPRPGVVLLFYAADEAELQIGGVAGKRQRDRGMIAVGDKPAGVGNVKGQSFADGIDAPHASSILTVMKSGEPASRFRELPTGKTRPSYFFA